MSTPNKSNPARKHLRVSRQREEYCKRLAYSAIQSHDWPVPRFSGQETVKGSSGFRTMQNALKAGVKFVVNVDWIGVGEDLKPEECVTILLWIYGVLQAGFYQNGIWFDNNGQSYLPGIVTHWAYVRGPVEYSQVGAAA